MRISPTLAACLALAASCAAEDDAALHAQLDLATGEKALLAADFNGDGRVDLAVAEEARGRVAILLNSDAGAFAPPRYAEAGANPTALAAVDFNGDGALDLAVANHERLEITLLEGDGAGGFAASSFSPLPIETQPHSHMIAAADMTGDGRADLIVDSRDRYGLYVLAGREGGGFDAPGQPIDVGGAPYRGFAIGDLNGDGVADLAAPNANAVAVLFNDGGEELLAVAAALPFDRPFAVAIADFDGDGAADVAAAGEDRSAGVRIFRNSETGFEVVASFPLIGGAKQLEAGDVDGDGAADLLATSWGGEALVVLGGESPRATSLPLTGLRAPWGGAFGDFDGDGRDEIAVADGETGRVNIFAPPP